MQICFEGIGKVSIQVFVKVTDISLQHLNERCIDIFSQVGLWSIGDRGLYEYVICSNLGKVAQKHRIQTDSHCQIRFRAECQIL